MFRTADFIFVGLVLIAATVTYIVKYGAEIEHGNIAKLQREINVEKEAIDILNANWALLTSPQRIQALNKRYSDELKLKNLEPEQVISVEKIPLKAIVAPDERQVDAKNGVGNPSDIVTGSIKVQEPKQ